MSPIILASNILVGTVGIIFILLTWYIMGSFRSERTYKIVKGEPVRVSSKETDRV